MHLTSEFYHSCLFLCLYFLVLGNKVVSTFSHTVSRVGLVPVPFSFFSGAVVSFYFLTSLINTKVVVFVWQPSVAPSFCQKENVFFCALQKFINEILLHCVLKCRYCIRSCTFIFISYCINPHIPLHFEMTIVSSKMKSMHIVQLNTVLVLRGWCLAHVI